jgi:hypothetical protein
MEPNYSCKCNRCGYEGSCKKNLVQHLRRKTLCPSTISDVDRDIQLQNLTKKSISDDAVQCKYCNKFFNSKPNMYRHLHSCKKNPRNNTQDDITILQKKIEDLQQEVHELKKGQVTSISNKNTINNNNNIHINNFGRETIDHLPNDFLTSCFMFQNMRSLVENTYFDKDCPSNHTITLKSMKNKTVKVYDDGDWKTMLADEALEEMINKGHTILSKHYKKNTGEIEEEMSEEEVQEVLDWLQKIYLKESRLIIPLKKQLMIVLCNNIK